MEFKSLKNIETSFRHLRLFGIVYLCVCTLLAVSYTHLTLPTNSRVCFWGGGGA